MKGYQFWTLVLIIMNSTGCINISWWLAFAPYILNFVVGIVISIMED